MKRDCSTCICKEGSCYPSTTIFDKDKTCKSYAPDYEGYIAELEDKLANADYQLEGRDLEIKELEKENADLKEEINKIAFARGNLEEENAELKTSCKIQVDTAFQMIYEKDDNLTKAKELLERLSCNSDVLNLLPNCSEVLRVRVEAEQFLSEVEK